MLNKSDQAITSV
uniref:Uncharacterized protein n=1 Tax=Arundo donax TaxID=35708 RepID=A0A0A9HNF7_ARUDO